MKSRVLRYSARYIMARYRYGASTPAGVGATLAFATNAIHKEVAAQKRDVYDNLCLMRARCCARCHLFILC